MELLLLSFRLALAVVFAIAGLAKFLDLQGTRKSLTDFGVSPAITPAASVALPLAELACVIAVLHDRWFVYGAIGMMAMLTVFAAAVAVNLARGRAPACHCFGQLSSSPVSSRTLVRNVVLLASGAVLVWKADEVPLTWPSIGNSAILTAIGVLGVLMTFVIWFSFHLLKQNGRLMLRLEVIEAKLNIDSDPEPHGLPIGDPAPLFELKNLAGESVSLRKFVEATKPLLLVFSDSDCGACEAMQPQLAFWQHQHEDQLTIVPIVRGNREHHKTVSATHDLRNVLLQDEREITELYQITATPTAVLVADGKIASHPEAGADAIRNLLTRATQLPAATQSAMMPFA